MNEKDYNILQDRVARLDQKVNTDIFCMLDAKEKHTDIKLKGKANLSDLDVIKKKANQADLEIMGRHIRSLEKQMNYLDDGSDTEEEGIKKHDE